MTQELDNYTNKNILLLLEKRTTQFDDRIALGIKSYLGWKELSFKGVGILTKRLANYLIKIGVEKGDKVAILSESMPEWGATLFANVLAGAITVPLDVKLTMYELTSILSDCLPKVILVSSAYFDKAIELKKSIPTIEHIIIIDDTTFNSGFPTLYTLPDESEQKWRHRAPNKTALIIYTSGTTGNPKGVEITFKNVVSQLEALSKTFDFGANDQVLSILPMNHLFELTVGFLTFLNFGTSIYYSKSLKPKDLCKILQEKRITFMIVVPAFAKLLKTTIETEISSLSPCKKMAFHIMYQIAQYMPMGIRKIMFKRIRKNFGPKFKGMLSGGAPLDPSIAKFFDTIGLEIYQGYGLTEASPVISTEFKGNKRLGSVGKALSTVTAKIDSETGELLVKGDGIMKGYYNKPELTAETVSSDGWLHTGDIAYIDKDGYIFITGRIKNMIVLSGGKKVFPEEVESVLEQSDNFDEVCVFGGNRQGGQKDGTEDVCVAVLPSQKLLDNYSGEDEIERVVKAEVKTLSQKLASYKRPMTVFVVDKPMPRTATRKIKKNVVKQMLTKC